MPFALEQLTQGLSIQDKIDPVSQAAATVNSTGFDMSKFRRILAIVQMGSAGAGGTLNALLQSAAASNFATPHNITGAAITQLTNANNNSVVTIEVRDDQVQTQNPGDRYVRLQITVGTNAVLVSALVLGGEAELKPASKQDIAGAVQRIVTP